MTKCAATTTKRLRCTRFVQTNSQYCWQHNKTPMQPGPPVSPKPGSSPSTVPVPSPAQASSKKPSVQSIQPSPKAKPKLPWIPKLKNILQSKKQHTKPSSEKIVVSKNYRPIPSPVQSSSPKLPASSPVQTSSKRKKLKPGPSTTQPIAQALKSPRHVTRSWTNSKNPQAKILFSPVASGISPGKVIGDTAQKRHAGKQSLSDVGVAKDVQELILGQSNLGKHAMYPNTKRKVVQSGVPQSNVQQNVLAMPRGVPYYPVVLESQGDETFRIPASNRKPPPSRDPVLIGQFYQFLNKKRPANSMGLALKAKSAYKRRVAEVSTMY